MKALPGVVVVLAALTIAANADDNLVCNPGFEEGADGWNLPETFTVVNDEAHSGAHSLRIVNTDAATYLLATQKIAFEPGMRYRFGAWIKTLNVKGDETGAAICMEWSGPKGWIGGGYADGRKGSSDWFHIEGVTGPVPPEATAVTVTLYLRPGMTGTAWFDDVTVAEYYGPALDAALLKPNYRGRFAADAADQHVMVRAMVAHRLKGKLKPEDARLVMEVLNENSEVQARTAVKPKGGANDLEIDMEKVPPGDYRLNVALLTQGGEELSAQQFELHKLPERTPQPTVYIDGHNRTLVNGQPFFPLAWYFGPGPTDKDFREHIDRIAASPFNTIMCYGINSGSTGDVRAYLDYLASHHLKLIYSIKDIYEGVGYNGETVLGFKGEENIVRGVVQVFRDHPAVLAWYLDDELPLTMRDRLEARQRLVSRLDTNHPTWAVLCEPADLPGYLNTADVLGTDPYPIPAKPVSMAGDWTQTSTDASAGLRPLWMVPQAFDWANYPKEWKEQGRAPTLAEELVMTYLCLIHGAHGLIFYSYFDLLHDRAGFEKRWADMLVVGREVKQLEPALLSTAKPPGFSVKVSDGSVQFAWRADDRGNAYLLLANPDPARNAWVSLVAPAGSQVRILRRAVERAVALSTSTNVYKIELAPIDAATVIVSPAR